MEKVFLDFYGQTVSVESDWREALSFIEKDFSCFVMRKKIESPKLTIQIFKENSATVRMPKTIAKMQTANSITYEENNVRFNDYYGKLVSVFDYSCENAKIYSLDLHKVHEVTYLLILSRVGKYLDLIGIHKLHAFGISFNNEVAFICMMPSKGGKSTLLLELLKDPRVKIISDDIPLINLKGEIVPFPIKIGIEKNFEHGVEVSDPTRNIYDLVRDLHGVKTFICLDGLCDRVDVVGKCYRRVIVAEGFRTSLSESKIETASFIQVFQGLFKHGIIGIGLPMVIEYFWEFGFVDFLRKSKIFFSRLIVFSVFAFRHKKLRLELGSNTPIAAAKVIKLLEDYTS